MATARPETRNPRLLTLFCDCHPIPALVALNHKLIVMNKLAIVLVFGLFLLLASHSHAQLLEKIKQKTKDKVSQRADDKTDRSIDKGLDKTEEATKARKGNKSDTSTVTDESRTENNNQESPSIKSYQNYDFVPGDKVLFEDNFIGEQDGEFPSHWELKKGQAVLNKLNGELSLYLTDGSYAEVMPRMKTQNYLTDPFTIEYDFYPLVESYGVVVFLSANDKQLGYERRSHLHINNTEVSLTQTGSGVELSKSYPASVSDNFTNKWHHVALVFKNKQLKVYVDQNRILVVPDTKEDYEYVLFAGIGDEKFPVIFKNVRIASGGGMNLIGKKFTDAKIVTHGINFDYNKAIIRPESMGTLNMIIQVMKENPDLKFEVGGHTDSDGDDNYNMQLSQQRAVAVLTQLISMGIDASRLTAKGYGESKPIADNNTPEGKANNRRVEFVKL